MKRVLLCICCLVLLSFPAMAKDHDFNGAFTLICPDHWELDSRFDPASTTDTYQCLGALKTSASLVEICISDDRAYYDDYSVPLVKDSAYFSYLSGLMAMMEDTEYVRTCEYVNGLLNEKGNAQFVVLYVDDGEGGYYYADTMIGGCTLSFYAYSDHYLVDTGARQLAELETVIKGIQFNDALFD